MTPALETRELRKVYAAGGAPVVALDRVDLQVRRGEFVAVMGPSGCGKSTLLHLLGGLDRPTSGEIWLNGTRMDRTGEAGWARARRRQIGYVFQFFNLIGNLPVADNVELPALVAGLSGREARDRREALLGRLGVGDVAGKLPGRLSGGQQQRVALARALINQPEVLLADEPTGNLDSASAAGVLGVIREHHAAGQTVVMVTHDARVAATADRVVRMRDGTVVSGTNLRGSDRAAVIRDFVELEA